MAKAILDAELKARLHNLKDQVELCDESGQTVGYCLSREDYERLLYDWLKAQATDEELERAAREPGGRTLAEIWKSLGIS